MAFETRSTRGKTYLYLSRRNRATGKVEKLYVGRGPDAEGAAAVLEERRQRRVAERQSVARLGAELRPADALTAELDGAVATLFEAAMLAAGYHRANYSRWRKRRTSDGQGG